MKQSGQSALLKDTRHGGGSNSRPCDYKASALTITPRLPEAIYSDLCKFRTLVWMVDVYSEIIKNNLSNIAVCETLMPPFPKLLRIGLTFDLLTWISIGIIYSSRSIIYPPSLKLLRQSVLEFSVAQGEVDWHDLWTTDLNINRDHLLIKDYLPTKFEASGAKRSWVFSCTRWSRLAWPLTYWPEYQ